MTTWHLVTGDYPPTFGGVADYTRSVASGLAASGEKVHVWCPGRDGTTDEGGVLVHREAGDWSPADLGRLTPSIAAAGPGGTVLVQWVPHAFGYRSLNVAFCRWIWRLGRAGFPVEVMIHEPFLSFREGSWKQDAGAVVHRAMIVLLLRTARRVWISIPAWEKQVRPWLLGRDVAVAWLPVPSNVDVSTDTGCIQRVRARYLGGRQHLLGHFGTYGRATVAPLEASLRRVLQTDPTLAVLLIGRDGERVRDTLLGDLPEAADRVHASGALESDTLSCHLQACDLLLQPYIDGASSRRGTLMAGLAHGLPVVTTVGRLSEEFWRTETGRSLVAVPAGDETAVAEAVMSLLADDDRRGRLGPEARALYDRRFAVRHTVSTLVAAREAA